MSNASINPNIVSYLHKEIARRTEYRAELEQLPPYLGHVQFYKQKRREKRMQLQAAIADLTKNIIQTAKKYLPNVEIQQDNDEATILAILAAMPPVEETIVKKVYHSSE